MKHLKKHLISILSCSCLLISISLHAQVTVLPPHSIIEGDSMGEWTTYFWQWGYSFSVPNDPFSDSTGAAYNTQTGPVFYLGRAATDQLTIQAGKYVFIPLVGVELSQAELGFNQTVPQLRQAAAANVNLIDNLYLTIDNVVIPNLFSYREISPVFNFVGAPDNYFVQFGGPVGPSGKAVSDGYYVMLNPLPPGIHTVQFGGTISAFNYEANSNITLTVITNNISTSPLSANSFCPEAHLNVTFSSVGVFNAGNVYTAQLSNSTASFSSPVNIGTLNSTANTGVINCVLPQGTPQGNGYRIRVISSDPIVIGSDNGSNLTIKGCMKPTGLNATNISANKATISWSGVACAPKYKLQYRKQNTLVWTSVVIGGTSKLLSGLSPNTTYNYRVQTLCTPNGSTQSGFTPIKNFTTLPLKEDDGTQATMEAIAMYPNPASGVVTITVNNPVEEQASLLICNSSGEQVIVQKVTLHEGMNQLHIDLSHVAQGIYFIKLKSSSRMMLEKLVKE